jgi:hypothetical protein
VDHSDRSPVGAFPPPLTPEQRVAGLTPEQLATMLTSDELAEKFEALPPEIKEK